MEAVTLGMIAGIVRPKVQLYTLEGSRAESTHSRFANLLQIIVQYIISQIFTADFSL